MPKSEVKYSSLTIICLLDKPVRQNMVSSRIITVKTHRSAGGIDEDWYIDNIPDVAEEASRNQTET